MTRTLALVVALGVAASTPTRAHATTTRAVAEPSATESLELGLAAYQRGEYREAVAHFERSYAKRPDPATLYAWAQAQRSAGDCAAAIDLYQRFLDTGATGDSRAAAIANQQRCREIVAATPTPEPPPPRPVTTPTPVEPPPPPPEPAPRAAYALLGTGAALVVAGIALVVAAEVQRRAQARTHDYDRFDALDRPIDGLFIGGGVSLGLGALLTTLGGVRLARHRRAR